MTTTTLTINGGTVTADIEPRLSLADFIRDHQGLTGTHTACEHGVCGACTLLLNGRPVRSCITLAVAVDGMEIRTIEGYDGDEVMSVIRACFKKGHAVQCGYCTPGIIVAAEEMLRETLNPTDDDIALALSGNLCRCTGYTKIFTAIRQAATVLREGGGNE